MLIPLLLKLGLVSQAVAGGKLALEGAEEATGVPVASVAKAFVKAAFGDVRGLARGFGRSTGLLVEGFADTAAGLLDPLHIFTDDPAQQRDQERAAKKKAQRAQKEAQAAAQAAQDQAAQLEQRANDAEARAKTAEDKAAAAEAAQKARASRRFASMATIGAQRSAQASGVDALRIAQQALELAKAAANPPRDARGILGSDAPADVKALVANVIDAMNRDQDPDTSALFDSLQSRLASSDSTVADAAEDELASMAMGGSLGDVAGHDHSHGKSKGCGASCACDTCKTEHALDWPGSDRFNVGELAVEGDGSPAAKSALDWPGAEAIGPMIQGVGVEPDPCPTGTCSTRRR